MDSRLHVVLALLLLICVRAAQVKSQKSLPQCLVACGQDIMKCSETCASKGPSEDAFSCIETCGVDNFTCMYNCATTAVTPPSPPAVEH
ncbi:hypothetical protein NC652_014866 [Populus alba x Populus x berolinensis]|nr:hypothetical protein NC652_014866 [Populus alba x Populus x berolinensis]